MERPSRYCAPCGANRPRRIPRAIQIKTQMVRYFSKKPRPFDLCGGFGNACSVLLMIHNCDSKLFEFYERSNHKTFYGISDMFGNRMKINEKQAYFLEKNYCITKFSLKVFFSSLLNRETMLLLRDQSVHK